MITRVRVSELTRTLAFNKNGPVRYSTIIEGGFAMMWYYVENGTPGHRGTTLKGVEPEYVLKAKLEVGVYLYAVQGINETFIPALILHGEDKVKAYGYDPDEFQRG